MIDCETEHTLYTQTRNEKEYVHDHLHHHFSLYDYG